MSEFCIQSTSGVLDESLSLRGSEVAGMNIQVCLSVERPTLLTFALFPLLLHTSKAMITTSQPRISHMIMASNNTLEDFAHCFSLLAMHVH